MFYMQFHRKALPEAERFAFAPGQVARVFKMSYSPR